MGNSAKVAMKIDMDDEAMNPMHEEIERPARAAEIERPARAAEIERLARLERWSKLHPDRPVARIHAWMIDWEIAAYMMHRDARRERAAQVNAWSVYLGYLLNEKIAQRAAKRERAAQVHAWSVYLGYLLNEKISQRERNSIDAGVGLKARNG